jgi:hypothetical protein
VGERRESTRDRRAEQESRSRTANCQEWLSGSDVAGVRRAVR